MNWHQQTVLVTGAGGFIGSHLTERLVILGARTRALVHYNSRGHWGWLESSPLKEEIDVILGDIRDAGSVRKAMRGANCVFHLAALIGIPYSYEAPRSYIDTNVGGTLNLLQVAMDEGVRRVVHTSTSEVYGTARSIPINEEHPLQGQSPYSASKIGADKLAEAYHLSFQLPVTIVRPFNTFGPRQSARAVIPTIITQALGGSAVRLGNVRPTRDFNFVSDTVEGFIKAAECPAAEGRVINIGSGREIAIGEVASLILKSIGKEIPIVCEDKRVRPAPSEIDRLCADNSSARTILGWHPQFSLEDGIVRTIDWVKGNLDLYRLGVYAI